MKERRKRQGATNRSTEEAAAHRPPPSYLPLIPATTTQFRKDYKRCEKQGRDVARLEAVMQALIGRRPLDASCKAHPLRGDWKDHEECHLGGDFLLIWRIEGDTITFVRVGNHQELFGR